MDNKEASRLFKLLSDESRIKIIKALYSEKEICACQLLEALDCTQPTLSHHMKVLTDSDLVKARKDWKWTHYSINKEKFKDLMLFFDETSKKDSK
jgi:ArsR family transcriptional regulator